MVLSFADTSDSISAIVFSVALICFDNAAILSLFSLLSALNVAILSLFAAIILSLSAASFFKFWISSAEILSKSLKSSNSTTATSSPSSNAKSDLKVIL